MDESTYNPPNFSAEHELRCLKNTVCKFLESEPESEARQNALVRMAGLATEPFAFRVVACGFRNLQDATDTLSQALAPEMLRLSEKGLSYRIERLTENQS